MGGRAGAEANGHGQGNDHRTDYRDPDRGTANFILCHPGTPLRLEPKGIGRLASPRFAIRSRTPTQFSAKPASRLQTENTLPHGIQRCHALGHTNCAVGHQRSWDAPA